MRKQGARFNKWLIAGIIFSFLMPVVATRVTAQGGAIELAVDTANVGQDGLLVLFGGLRLQGDIGLPVGAGDINGDERADVIFCGMYGSSIGRRNNGVVNFYISDGRDTGFVDSALNPPSIFRLEGQRSGDLLGTSVSANGDVNGDGLRDVAIGASAWDRSGGGIADNRGIAYVVLGNREFNQDIDLSAFSDSIPPPGIIAIQGPQSNGRLGIWIDEGDVDGDGFADVIIGSDQMNSAGSQHVGGAFIVFGAASLPPVIDLAAPPPGVRTARIVGQRQEEHWGAAFQVGDVNNDSIGDVIIGGSIFRDSASYVTPQDEDSGHDARGAGFNGQRPGCGEAYVIYGQRNWPAETLLSNPPPNATRVIGAKGADFLGSQVHSGDLNGDGRNDLVIGALQAEAPDNRGKTGAVYVIYGSANLPGATIDLANPSASGLIVTTIYGEHHLDCAGDSVRTYDINKDGLSDLFVGSPERSFHMADGEGRYYAGVTEVIYGQRDFLPSVIKLYEPPASPRIFRLAGGHSGDEFSYRLTGGDVDGDGFIDYISNAMHASGAGGVFNGGNVYIFSGKKLSAKVGMLPPPITDPTPVPVLSSAVLSLNGQTVQQALAGQNGLQVTVTGTNVANTPEILINGVSVISHSQGTGTLVVNLDENPLIRNTAGPLTVRARNTTPQLSDLSNQITAGTLVGPVIDRVKVKKKGSGLVILKIRGTNFPSAGTVVVTANGAGVPVQSTSFEASDFVSARIGAAFAPPAGTIMLIRVVTGQGIQSNEFAATAK